MSQRTGLFGLKVAPGEIVPLDIFSNVRITNIAFGEEIKGDARTVVKVHRARFVDELDDLSEFDDEDDEDDEEEEEDEEDGEDATTKVNGKKVNGVVEGESEEENEKEEDDEDDDEDDEDDDDDEVIEEDFVICSLYPKKTEQAIVDLEFSIEEEVAFSVTGENAVELLGYYVESDPYDDDPDSDELYDDEDEDEYDSDEMAMFAALEGGEYSEGESDEESDEDMEDKAGQIEEVREEAAAAVSNLRNKAAAGVTNLKKRAKGDESDEEVNISKEMLSSLSKNQRKKLNKKLKTDAGDESTEVKEKEEKKVAQKDTKTKIQEATKKDGKKITTPSGLIIEDKQVGSGPQAKAGNRIAMRYVGRLLNGKQFDANTSGKPFQFKLGKGEVIAGWDEGIKGMQVGGSRRLTIPAKLAYGKQGAPPDIPGNSTLCFDVKLVEIK